MSYTIFQVTGSPEGIVTHAGFPFVLLAIAIAMLVVSYVITALLMPKPQKVKPASLEDFEMPQKEEGTPQAVIFGEGWTQGPQILWYGNLRTKKIKAEGGK
jgi:hypothetical protein